MDEVLSLKLLHGSLGWNFWPAVWYFPRGVPERI